MIIEMSKKGVALRREFEGKTMPGIGKGWTRGSNAADGKPFATQKICYRSVGKGSKKKEEEREE